MKYILFLFLTIFWSNSLLLAQEQILTGRVVDSKESSLSNVNIKVLETGQQTQTNQEGSFTIQIHGSKPFQLSFTLVGFEDKLVTVNSNESIEMNVVLDPLPIELEEVVVSTGYQTLPKERATGSFSVIDNTTFNTKISTDIISRLDGLVPGVLFDKRMGQEQTFQIRGISTLAGSSSELATPLIILDNFPYEGDINNINPNDVESITFLKDAAASSIWGAKAGNGVVVITTKRASYNQNFKLAVSSNFTFSEKPNLWYSSQMSSSDYIDTELFLFEKGAYNASLANSTNRPVISPVVELLEQVRTGEVLESDAMREIDRYRTMDLRNDYDRYIYRPAFKQQFSMNLSGGNEKISYLFSSGWDKNLTSLKENKIDRLTLRSFNSFKPAKGLEVDLGVTYTLSNRQNNNNAPFNLGLASGKSMYPYAQLANEEGKAIALPQNYRSSFVETAGDGKLLDWKYYPLKEINQRDNTSRTNNLLFNASVNYKMFSWLTANLKYNYQDQELNNRDLKTEDLFSTRDYINRFTVLEPDKISYNVPLGSILMTNQANLKAHNVRGQMNVDVNFGTDHQINGLIGGEIRNAIIESHGGTTYGYDDYLKISSPVDYLNRYPIFEGLAFNQPVNYQNNYSLANNRFVSLYANASYRYLNRYTLSGSMRRDASNLFGVKTNDKWKPLWSIGGKWDASKEEFYSSELIPSLSLRATYGYSGNVNNSIPAVVTIDYDKNLSPLGRNKNADLRNAPNPELRWESTEQINMAVDFVLKSRRIAGTVEYYVKKSYDLISIMDSDPTIGFNNITRNSANLRNKGWEIQLTTVNVNREFSWNSNLMLSYNKNKLTKYLYNTLSYSSALNGSLIPLEAGYSLNSLFSHKWNGLDPENGDPLGYIDGEVSKDYVKMNNPNSLVELHYHGSLLPQYFGSIRNTLGYKRISLNFSLTGMFDYYFRRQTIDYSSLLSPLGAIGHGDYNLRWQKPGDELNTTVPSLVYPSNSNRDIFYRNSEATVEKGDHVRVQDLNISYAFRSQKKILKNAKVTCYMNNLNWILWKATNTDLDPLYNNTIPTQRNIAIGLTTSF